MNKDHITAASRLTLAQRAARIADTDEAIAKGAVQGPTSVWPDPAIQMSHVQTAEEAHWTRAALRLTPDELAATRAAMEELPPTAVAAPPAVVIPSYPGQGQGGHGRTW